MFTSARLKLTAWYLLIIMLVSVLFSFGIYALINDDYNRLEQVQRARMEREQKMRPLLDLYRDQLQQQGLPVPPMPASVDLEPITQARFRLQAILGSINLVILGVAGLAGFFLAGRTLRPIKQMVDEQNRFIADASHELRTPLTALKTSIEVGLRDKKMTKSDAQDLLQGNLEEVNELQMLSDSLLDLANLQISRNGAILEVVNVKELITQGIQKVEPLAKKKKITLNQDGVGGIIEADKESLLRMLIIFLDNAIKYSKIGESVRISTQKTDHRLKITVVDQGVGIAEDDLPHIFERFYRADKSRSQGGYGLGLAIANKIIQSHHGLVGVTSKPNEGTTFSITLPLKQPRF